MNFGVNLVGYQGYSRTTAAPVCCVCRLQWRWGQGDTRGVVRGN